MSPRAATLLHQRSLYEQAVYVAEGGDAPTLTSYKNNVYDFICHSATARLLST